MSDSPAPEQPAERPAGHHPAIGPRQARRRRDRHRVRRHRHQPDLRLPRDLRRPSPAARRPTCDIFGVLSLIFWSMMIVVTIKYVTVIMRADNKGEGGSLALLALINRKSDGGKRDGRRGIILLGVFACALFYGDSMITPAISVLSAVEGLTTVEAGFAPYVVPIAIAHPGRPVRDPGARHGQGRRPVRADHAGLFPDHLRCSASCTSPTIPAIILETLNPLNAVHFFLDRRLARLPRAGLGGAGGDRRRGALCRHGPFRAQADRHLLAVLRACRR